MGELKKCPKCQSTKLHINRPSYLSELNSGGQNLNIRTGSTPFSFVILTKYMCFSCGYVWLSINDKKSLKKLKKYSNREDL